MKIPPTEFLAKAHSVVLIHQMATSTSEIKGLEGAYSVAKKILKTTRRGSDKEIKNELGREREKTNGNHRCLQTSLLCSLLVTGAGNNFRYFVDLCDEREIMVFSGK